MSESARATTSAKPGYALALALAMLCAAAAAVGLAPREVREAAPAMPLEDSIPNSVGHWHGVPGGLQQVSLFATDEDGGNPMRKVYDDSLLRSYTDPDGHLMMVAIAYDHVQREEDRVHRPEICYVAQGFNILDDHAYTFDMRQSADRLIEGRRMLTRNGNRLEAVSFWIRTGDSFTQNAWRSRSYVIAEGLAGRLHDGILVRVSEVVANPADATASYERQQRFLAELIAALPPDTARQLASHPGQG